MRKFALRKRMSCTWEDKRQGWGKHANMHVQRITRDWQKCQRQAMRQASLLPKLWSLQAMGGQLKGTEHGSDMLRLVLQNRGQKIRAHQPIPAQHSTVKRWGSWRRNSGVCEIQCVFFPSNTLLFPVWGSRLGLGLAKCLWGPCQPRPNPSSHWWSWERTEGQVVWPLQSRSWVRGLCVTQGSWPLMLPWPLGMHLFRLEPFVLI